ncbi:MAG: EAL domain-containing protein [Nocardioidaceae bacterium]
MISGDVAMTLREGRDGLALLDRNSPLRLLVIEDSSTDSHLVLALLRDQLPHALVDVEVSLDAALDLLAEHRFDLVLADLPEAQRAPVVRAVRNTRPETPLMVLTGRIDGALALWALAEGAQDLSVEGQQDQPGLATALVHALRRERAEEESLRYLELARGLLDAWDVPTCAVDCESRIVAVNRAWRDFVEDNDGTDELCGVGVSYLDTCDRAAADVQVVGAAEAALVAQGIRHVLDGSLDRFRHDYPCHSPSENRWFTVQVTPALVNDGRGAVITHVDVTDLHVLQVSFAHQSLHDPLTGLPNRALVEDRLGQAISDGDRSGLGVAVAHLDLFRYQGVNDRLGYRGGDAVLVQVAERLLAQLRPGATLARLAGDEFLVLWRDLDADHPDEAVAWSEELLGVLERPFDIADVSVHVSASVGVARHTCGHDVDQLLHAADAALIDAKTRGPGCVALFTEELLEERTYRMVLEAELRLALAEPITQLVLHYQPVVNLTSGKVVAVESLVRWQHPVRGLLGPDRFIPLAEAAGLVHLIGDWVLLQAIRDQASLTHEGRELDLAVNFSVQQLDEQTVTKLRRAIEAGDVRASRLILEVTESAFVKDEKTMTTTLEALSELGIRIAVDDFGTGYSSLLYLSRYPIDVLKIDCQFVAGIGKRQDDEAICASIISLAAAVGATSIGEGVETSEQYAVLRSLGCVQAQGFLWSPAVPIDELAAALAACDRIPVAAPPSRPSRTRQDLDSETAAFMARMHTEGGSSQTIDGALDRRTSRGIAGRLTPEEPPDGAPGSSRHG